MIWNIPQAVLVISVFSVVCWTPGLMTRFGLRWLEAELCQFVYATPQRTMILLFCFLTHFMAGLVAAAQRPLLADGGEFCWDVCSFWAAGTWSTLSAVCPPRLRVWALHFQSLTIIKQNDDFLQQKHVEVLIRK